MTGNARTPARQAVERAIKRRLEREARSRWKRFLIVAGLLVLLDQAVKAVVRASLALGESRSPLSGVTIRRIDNEGIAFGLFPGRSTLIAVITLVALGAIGVILSEIGRKHPAVPFGGGLLVGGSIGNVIDRVTRGAVTDFVKMPGLDNYFNVADMGITGGALLIAFGLWRTGEEPRPDIP